MNNMTIDRFLKKWLGLPYDSKASLEMRDDLNMIVESVVKLSSNSIHSICETETPILHAFAKSEKRFYAACMAMQGILASQTDLDRSDLVRLSFNLADAMIEEESKTLKNE
jgi:hypothetical protein